MQVAAHLTRRIVSGDLEDGRAPSELDISREFGVSRVVARETLKILASLDMVEVAQGRRVVVRPPAEWDYLSPLLIELLPTEIVGELLQELHQMRVLLEPELAAMAATSVTGETLERLRDELDRMAALEGDPNAYLEVDHEFHMEICRAADNRILDRIMYSARWLGTASRRITNEAPAALRKATADHTEIYEALVAGDPAGARAAMRKHLANNSTLLAEKEQQTRRATRRR
ncbi:FadR/GntR family transcriptional regulator [Lentzea sp.]|uniref:FadR/GntR family transcriptional regulator n=1 Tax=Lentzea sp. TaxID=56099 RepID=UPI002BFACA1D|nr:FCD domain-containing protein [Lentzea sp.]HUQ56427.1 FCD domain-containing protein [Lentzea sp.]